MRSGNTHDGDELLPEEQLTANHGLYYIDTTVSDANQRAGLLLALYKSRL
jgi:hypothetical protein